MIRCLLAMALIVGIVSSVGCGLQNAKYGKCYTCGKVYGMRGGNLPGQASVCEKCGGHIYWPDYKSGNYYEFKSEFGGTED